LDTKYTTVLYNLLQSAELACTRIMRAAESMPQDALGAAPIMR
jgi:hypothetical protein